GGAGKRGGGGGAPTPPPPTQQSLSCTTPSGQERASPVERELLAVEQRPEEVAEEFVARCLPLLQQSRDDRLLLLGWLARIRPQEEFVEQLRVVLLLLQSLREPAGAAVEFGGDGVAADQMQHVGQ